MELKAYREGDLAFKTVGTLKDFSVIPLLHNIKQPTLLINGQYDMCPDDCLKQYFQYIPKIKWLHLMNVSHMPFFEDREKFFDLLGEFLTDVKV